MAGAGIGPFHGAFLKLQRAAAHREQLEQEIDEFFRHEPDRVVAGRDGAPVLLGDPLPPRWSTTVGDCLQNLRSTVEHIAWACALRNTPEPGRDVTFKITETANDWTKYAATRSGKLNAKALGEDAWLVLQEMQPHKRGSIAPRYSPLWGLNELARVDRHRTLHFAVIQQAGRGMLFGPSPKVGNIVVGAPHTDFPRFITEPRVTDAAEVITADPPEAISPYAKVYSYVAFDIAFGPDSTAQQGFLLLKSLDIYEQEIRTFVLPAFQALEF
jgi:hypothetical protein